MYQIAAIVPLADMPAAKVIVQQIGDFALGDGVRYLDGDGNHWRGHAFRASGINRDILTGAVSSGNPAADALLTRCHITSAALPFDGDLLTALEAVHGMVRQPPLD
jgi:hypothetical protein